MLIIKRLILALLLGSTLAALISVAVSGPESVTVLIAIGVAGTYVIFGLVPAVAFGLPALWVLKRRNVTRLVAVLAMTVGGAAVGALVTFGIFNRFEPLGAIGGASIGLLQGFLMYPKPVRVDAVVT
jgi:hypothetical protein